MHRQFSLQPFSRHYSHSTNPFLDFLEIDKPSFSESPSLISVTPDKRADMLEVLMAYKSVQASGTLHTLTFITVNDYLWLLRSVSQELSILRRGAMYYLAAAVSDFFLPRQKMVGCILHSRISDLKSFCLARSPNTRFSRAREVYTSRWIRFPKF
jgi:phosphopantothenate-cysteine ligase